MTKNGVEHLAQHPGWKTRKTKKKQPTTADLLRSAASALDHGRYGTASKKFAEAAERLNFAKTLREVWDANAPTRPTDHCPPEDAPCYCESCQAHRHPQTPEHLAACPSCMMAHDKALPDAAPDRWTWEEHCPKGSADSNVRIFSGNRLVATLDSDNPEQDRRDAERIVAAMQSGDTLLSFARQVARMTNSDECNPTDDDVLVTMDDLIAQARKLTGVQS